MSSETNEQFATRMRKKRGQPHIERSPHIRISDLTRPTVEDMNGLRDAVRSIFVGFNTEIATAADVEARIRTIPGVEDVWVLEKDRDHLDLRVLRVGQTPSSSLVAQKRLVAVCVDLER